MALLGLKNVGKRVGGTWALWDVTLEINAGEIVGILGRSGSGKSTLASILAGLQQPTSGVIEPGGERSARLRPSVAFQIPACAPELTVYENLQMFAALWDTPRRTRAKDIAFLLELVGLSDRRGNVTSHLSVGALRRLEIARALLADSPVTVIDSLLDTLDARVFEKLWDHLLALRRGGLKSVVVLTASGKVGELCPRLAVIHRGRIEFIGKPDDFRRLAGDDTVVLGDVMNTAAKKRIQEKFALVVREEDGFLSFRVAGGDRLAADLLAEFGSDLSCVYLKRPTLEDALDVLETGGSGVAATVSGRANE